MTSETITCVDCRKIFKAKHLFNKHRKHHDKTHACEICGKLFGLKPDLKRHRNGHLPSPFIYKCPYRHCKFNGSQRKELLSAHLREYHANDEKLGRVKRLSLDGEAALTEQRRLMNEAQTLAFLDCISRGDTDDLERFFSENLNAHLIARTSTAIHICITKGHQSLIRPLLQHGVDIEMSNKNGDTALHLACEGKKYDVVKVLLGFGANVNAVSKKGYTPLHHAAMNGDKTLVELIISAKPDYEVKSLHVHHHNVFLRDGTALHYAVARGDVCTVKLLLAGGACADSVNTSRETPLHLATKVGHLDIAKSLLASGASIDFPTKSGKTPLHFAVEGRHETTARILLASGARFDLVSNRGRTPFHCAAERGYLDIARLLLAGGADIEHLAGASRYLPLREAVKGGHTALARLLLESGARVDCKDYIGQKLLHYAAERQNPEMVNILLEANAQFDIKDRYGFTPLSLAIGMKKSPWGPDEVTHEQSTKLLLAARAKFSLDDWNYLSLKYKNMFALYRPAGGEQPETSDPAIIPWIAESDENYVDIVHRYSERGPGQ